jgi:hypothetical protein
MPVPDWLADRRDAEAMIAGADGYDGHDLLPALCRRHHLDACRRAVLRRTDGLMVRRRGPNA